jgi:hypothetical protein
MSTLFGAKTIVNTGDLKTMKNKTLTTKTIKIAKKMSGTGTIFDIQSEHHERLLVFNGKQKFAIVYPAHLNWDTEYFDSYEDAEDFLGNGGYGTIINRSGLDCLTMEHIAVA